MNNKFLKGRSGLLVGTIAGLMLGGVSLSSQAQECVTTNWTGGEVNSDQLAAGSPLDGHSRYGGPCSLKVELSGGMSYVADDRPIGENQYNVRFYFNPNGSTTDPYSIFAANDADDGSGDDVLQLWFNEPGPGQASLLIATAGDTTSTIVVDAADLRTTGWNSFEIAWVADASADVALSVNGNDDQVANGIDTSGQLIRSALLGYVGSDNPIVSGTPVYFDDFDSRRVSRPGRLCRGLTDDSRDELTFQDASTIADDAVSPATIAPGTPDYDEDGVVTFSDAVAVANRAVSPALRPCSENR